MKLLAVCLPFINIIHIRQNGFMMVRAMCNSVTNFIRRFLESLITRKEIKFH